MRLAKLLLGALLASPIACTPELAYRPVTSTSAIVRPRASPRGDESQGTQPSVAPTTHPAPCDKHAPIEESGGASLEVLGVGAALPLVVPVTPSITPSLAYPRPAVDRASDLPGSAEVISTAGAGTTTRHEPTVPIQREQSITTQRTFVAGVGTRRLVPFWLFPFFPFGLAKAWSP